MPGTKQRDKVENLTEIYWRDIRDTQPLSRMDEIDLFTRIRQGDEEAREKVITSNLRFVVSVAREYKDYGLSLLELVSEGNVGLLEAVKRFDETRGFKFITYAVWWIRQAILKALAEQGRIARPPMSQVNDLQKLEKEAGVLAQRLGRDPTDIELSEHVDISMERTRNAMRISQQDLSFDAPVFPEEDTTLHAVIGSDGEGADEALDERETKRRIADCLEVLGRTRVQDCSRLLRVRQPAADDPRADRRISRGHPGAGAAAAQPRPGEAAAKAAGIPSSQLSEN